MLNTKDMNNDGPANKLSIAHGCVLDCDPQMALTKWNAFPMHQWL